MHALVTSSLDYCNTVCVGLPSEMACKLQPAQNATVDTLMRASRLDHIALILQELYWLPIIFCVQLKVVAIWFGTWLFEGLSSQYDPTHAACPPRRLFFCVLPASEVQLVGTGGRAFSVAAPVLWNSLLRDACPALSLMTIRGHVKMELLGWAFN